MRYFFKTIIIGFIFLFLTSSNLSADNSENFISNITSSTYFSQNISNSTGNIEVITSKEIKLLGAENIPDLMQLISNIILYSVNGATANISFPGLPPMLRINPVILLDGMEITEPFYSRTYLYNIPVLIDDIDRIEIIRDSSSFTDGYSSPGGIINIVTKQPQYLTNNYISTTIGSNNLTNHNFSINRYNFSTYWKLTGSYRGINDYEQDRRINKSKMFNLSIEKYFKNSKLFLKGSISNQDLEFLDNQIIALEFPFSFLLHESLDNLLMKNFLINYKFPHFDTTFYYQGLSGFTYVRFQDKFKKGPFRTEYYKWSTRYSYKNFLSGIEAKYCHAFIEDMDSGYDNSISFFVDTYFKVLKYFQLKTLIRNDFVKNNGSNLNYKFNIGYTSRDKTFNINLGYSKSIKLPDLYQKYFSYKSVIPKENITLPNFKFDIPVVLYPKKNIRPTKIYITDLSISNKWEKFFIKQRFFYNRLKDTFLEIGSITISNFQPLVNISSKNFSRINIYGFESEIKYNFDKNFKFYASYFHQKLINKTFKKTDKFIPKYKITGVLLYSFNNLSGNIGSYYYPAIKSSTGSRSDYIFSINANLNIKLLKDKLELSLNGKNLFNDDKKEIPYGEKIDRAFLFKLKYNF